MAAAHRVERDKKLRDPEAGPYEPENLRESAEPSLPKDPKTKPDASRSCSEDGCREAEDVP